MADIKEMKNENATINNEEQQATTPAPETAPEEKKEGKIKTFFKTHGNKIKVGLGLAGAVGVGIAADRLGIKIGGKKKDETASESAE